MPTGLFGAPAVRDQMVARAFGANNPAQPQQPEKRPGLGTRLLGEGWAEKVAALGGMIRGDPNAVPDFHSSQQHRADQAERLRQASLERDTDWQDWVRRQEYERANPKPSTAQPHRWEDNAGNVWQLGASGQPERIFTDTIPRMYVQGDRAVQIPNPFASGGEAIGEDRKAIGGKSYVKRGGEWFEEGASSNAGGTFPGAFGEHGR